MAKQTVDTKVVVVEDGVQLPRCQDLPKSANNGKRPTLKQSRMHRRNNNFLTTLLFNLSATCGIVHLLTAHSHETGTAGSAGSRVLGSATAR